MFNTVAGCQLKEPRSSVQRVQPAVSGNPNYRQLRRTEPPEGNVKQS